MSNDILMNFRACLKIHSWHLHAPLRGIFVPNSLNAAHYAAFIWHKSPTKWHAQLPESNFQTRSRIKWRKGLSSKDTEPETPHWDLGRNIAQTVKSQIKLLYLLAAAFTLTVSGCGDSSGSSPAAQDTGHQPEGTYGNL